MVSSTTSATTAAAPTRRRRKDARPAELLAAALDLFVERGYAATRLDDVAAKAGVSKGTLYLYFDSKEALFQAVVREGLLPALAETEQVLVGFTGSASELVRKVAMHFWRTIGSQRIGGIPKLVFAEARNFPEIAAFYHREVIQRGMALARGVVEYGIARGEFRPAKAEATCMVMMAPLLMRMIWNYSLDCCALAGVSTEDYFEQYFEIVLHGLCSTAEGNA
jgi:AcrR family transcriptional regulator